jgi:hypothetical protein
MLSDKEIQRRYFLSTIQKLKNLNITLPKGTYKSKASISKQINVSPEAFLLKCKVDKKNTPAYLAEVVICYDQLTDLGAERIRACPPVLIKSTN